MAEWLRETGHGHNVEAELDSPAFSIARVVETPMGKDRLLALLALRAVTGEDVGGRSADELLGLADGCRLATDLFPDACTLFDGDAETLELASLADELSDAAFSTARAADRVVEERVRVSREPPLIDRAAQSWFASLIAQLLVSQATDTSSLVLHADGAMACTLALAASEQVPEHASVTYRFEGDQALASRRQAATRELWIGPAGNAEEVADGQTSRGNSRATTSTVRIVDLASTAALTDLESAFERPPGDVLLILGAASLLTAALATPSETAQRAALLRTGRVRAVVALPEGIDPRAPRRRLAMWLVSTAQDDQDADRRWTSLADLRGRAISLRLDSADAAALASDLLAVSGGTGALRSRAFTYLRPASLPLVLARRGALTESAEELSHAARPVELAPSQAASTASRLAELADAVRRRSGEAELLRTVELAPETAPAALPSATLGRLRTDGHVRLVQGTRLVVPIRSDRRAGHSPSAIESSGTTVLGLAELLGEMRPGSRRVDPFDLASEHPRSRLTEPGDVVFATSPRPLALVDSDGYSVVEAPARILRINESDSAGLLPRALALEITQQAPDGTDWMQWRVRRAVPKARPLLERTLETANAARAALEAALASLAEWEKLATAGITGGMLTDASLPEAEGIEQDHLSRGAKPLAGTDISNTERNEAR
ncbi:hypothetical protein C5E05_17295 [Pseudoclavibacter sp. AY1H1]|nr:hypothetical protein C5E05_17295 [Pseudoclavibacter sp. AY1H1]